jgi:hypothetical protein
MRGEITKKVSDVIGVASRLNVLQREARLFCIPADEYELGAEACQLYARLEADAARSACDQDVFPAHVPSHLVS